MAKVDVTQELINLATGKPIELVSAACDKCGQATESQTFTLRLICTRALADRPQQRQGDPPRKMLPGEESVGRFQLAMRILNEDEPSLSAEEIVLTKESIAEFYDSPGIVGQAWMMLDPSD